MKTIFFKRRFTSHVNIHKYQSLRLTAKKIGISYATLSRICNGKTPDLITYAKVCKWMGKNMNEYFK